VSSQGHGFSLKGVCWGYRDVFERVIGTLHDEGLLGPANEEVTARFAELLKRSERNLFDHVLYDFLKALNPRTRWIVSLPAIFADVTEMGCRLAESRIYYGTTFFRLLGEEGLGRTPDEVSHLMTLLKRVRRAAGDEMAFALLRGYRKLVERLGPAEIERYVEEALAMQGGHPRTAQRFLEGTLAGCETAIRTLSRECTLGSVAAHLGRLLKALCGRKIDVGDLAPLDPESLRVRGSTCVCLHGRLHLLAQQRAFATRDENREWYVLSAVCAAALYRTESFPAVHGHRSYRSAVDLVGDDPVALNLLQIVEYTRALGLAREAWPGVGPMLDRALAREAAPDGVLQALAGAGGGGTGGSGAGLALLRRIAGASVNVFDTVGHLTPVVRDKAARELPELTRGLLAPLSFLPDFLYRGETDAPPSDAAVADLRERAGKGKDRQDEPSRRPRAASTAKGKPTGERSPAAGSSGFVYDEWSQNDRDYLPDHCVVHEIHADPVGSQQVSAKVLEQAQKTRRIFEWLKPDLAAKEKRLESGDAIDVDLLVDFLVSRRREPSPPVRFYQKPRIVKRDLATLVLMDCSGSTGEEREAEKIIEVERESALILGQGLAGLGDGFAICGFSGQGRENCEYYVYKGFADAWDSTAIRRLMGAAPRSSTRIGAALRHSGTLLRDRPSRQKLILLITDGRPMDAGYDPETRYAQFDVRMACEENRRRGIHTFAISTEKASRADMEIMFPARRFAILPSIDHLPSVLPRLYMRLTW
jgi:hypothetical protein